MYIRTYKYLCSRASITSIILLMLLWSMLLLLFLRYIEYYQFQLMYLHVSVSAFVNVSVSMYAVVNGPVPLPVHMYERFLLLLKCVKILQI